jgi:hypothetical protein
MQPPEGQPRPPQPPYQPQPGQQYGPPQYPQQPWQQQPGQPPKKRRRTWLWIVLGVLVIVVLGCIGVVALATSATKTSTSTLATTIATSIPTSAKTQSAKVTPQAGQKWTTVRTFSGSSSKKTPFFTVPENWRLNWTCKGGEFGGNLSVTVYGPGNAYVDLPVNASCPAGKTVSDTTEEHQGGSIYLDISALSDWSIMIQELK